MSIALAPQYTQRNYRWTAWKTVKTTKALAYQADDDGTIYTVYGYDGPEVHVCQIFKGTVPYAIVDSGYSQSQNDSDKSDFETNFLSGANAPLNITHLAGHTDNTKIGNVSDSLKVIDQGAIDMLTTIATGQTTSSNPLQFSVISTVDGTSPKYECQVTSSTRAQVAEITVPAGKKWYITSWDGSGDAKGYYQLMKEVSAGYTSTYDSCEVTTGWTVSGLTSFSASTSAPSEGTKSFTASLATNSNGVQTGYFEKASLNLDWSTLSSVKIATKRSGINGVAVDISFKIYTASNSYTFSSVSVTSSWSEASFDLTQVSFSLTSVTKIQVIFTEHTSGMSGPTSVWIDNIRTSVSDSYEPIDQFYAGGYTPYQNLFPTNLLFSAGTVLALFITNKDSVNGNYEIGINGREVTV